MSESNFGALEVLAWFRSLRFLVRVVVALCAVGFPVIGLAAEDLAGKNREWKQIRKVDGIVVFEQENPDSGLLAFKGEGVVEAKIGKVATVIFDATRAKEWVEDLVSSRIVRWDNPTEFLEYDHIGTPFVLKDRDFLSHVRMVVEPAEKRISFLYQAVSDSEVPVGRYIRGDMSHSSFVLTAMEGGVTRVSGEIHCDPKGSVPKWIVNYFQKDWGVKTLKKLREQVGKTDIAIDPKFVTLFSSF